jgi:ribosomal protein S18 acetylase RimI-like enzyme
VAIEIRILTQGDRRALDKVAPGVFDNAVDPRLADEFLRDPRHHIVAAIEDGVIVGFASGVHYVHPDKAPELFINEVGIAPSHHRQGLGKAVVASLLEVGRRLGCGEAWVLTDRENTAAMALYASAGGEEAVDPSIMFNFRLNR